MEKINPSNQYNWYAVYIRSRAEKKAHMELQQRGIETFLPLHRKLRQWSDRKKWVELPLISGYLFVRVSRFEYDQVLQSAYVVSYVRFEGIAAIIPDEQIEYLKLMLNQNKFEIEVTDQTFETQQSIKVVAGPLIGLEGKLIEFKGKNRVAIELVQLGFSAFVEISMEDIVPQNAISI